MAVMVENLINQFELLKVKEKEDFLGSLMKLIARRAFSEPVQSKRRTFSHRQVFGDLEGTLFTFAEACEYLERSAPQVRRYVADQAMAPARSIGRNQMFDLAALKIFKKTLSAKTAKATKRSR